MVKCFGLTSDTAVLWQGDVCYPKRGQGTSPYCSKFVSNLLDLCGLTASGLAQSMPVAEGQRLKDGFLPDYTGITGE